ncbi:MAG: M20/M25/M40 family metallo-hydrolase, partial [Kiritimatiellae bacterium]|nr:M20/M25/M40 family metallo-hydrolase [Kiritimatiellia bacterium]
MKKTLLTAIFLSAAVGLASGAPAGGPFPGLRENLLALLRIPSVTSSVDENNRAVEALRGWLDARGVFTSVETNDAGRTALYASAVPGKCHDVVFVTHLDVVPPSEEGQFEPREADGLVWGRGACDAKGNVAVVAQVLANLAGKASVGAVFATDEETRVPGKATPAMLLERGYVPRKLVLVADTNGEHSDALAIAEKGHVLVTVRARGRGGHSSIPQSADNPIPKLLAAYGKIRGVAPDPQRPGDAWRDDLVPTQLSGSSAGNTIPDAAEMVFSFRFTTPDAPMRLKESVERETGLEVVLPATWREPVLTDPENPWIRSLHAAMRRRWPERDVKLARMSCATDATHYVHLGIPVAIFSVRGEGAHSAGERVSLGSCMEYAAMFTEYLRAELSRPVRLAVYAGAGARGAGAFRWIELTACAENVEATLVDAAAILGGALDGKDALVVPGGRSVLAAKALGKEGVERIRSFVAGGGGYAGTCAGCCLAMQPSACHPGMAGFIPFTFGKAGGGDDVADLMVRFNARAEALLGVPKGDRRLCYSLGPVPVPSLPVEDAEIEVVATYASDVNGRSGRARPSMAGQAAAVAGTYGKGRVFATAVHPEGDAADHDILRGALRYVARRGDVDWRLPQR